MAIISNEGHIIRRLDFILSEQFKLISESLVEDFFSMLSWLMTIIMIIPTLHVKNVCEVDCLKVEGIMLKRLRHYYLFSSSTLFKVALGVLGTLGSQSVLFAAYYF